MPLAEEANEEIALKLAMQHLRYEVQVAYEGRLQDDGYVTSIEELDGVGETLASHTLAIELKLNSEALIKFTNITLDDTNITKKVKPASPWL